MLPDEAEIFTPSISLPSGNWPVMSVPMQVADHEVVGRRSAVDLDAPVIGRDQVHARAAGPADGVAGGVRDQDALLGVGQSRACRSCRCRSGCPRSGCPWPTFSISIPTLLPEMTCDPAAFPWIVTPLAPSMSTPW